MNQQFHVERHQINKQALAKIDAVIVYKDSALSLWRKNEETYTVITTTPVINRDDEYDTIKKISHIPLLIQTLLATPAKEESLLKVRHDLTTLLKDLTLIKNGAHKEILEKSLDFLMNLNSNATLNSYMQSINPALDKECECATDIQLNRLDNLLRDWTAIYNIDWKKCRVIVAGSHGPREGMIEMQYIQHFLEQIGLSNPENDYLYYAESLPTHADKIDIKHDLIETFLGGMEGNKEYGISVLGDKKAMGEDVLKKHAQKVINGLFSQKTSRCPMAASIQVRKMTY